MMQATKVPMKSITAYMMRVVVEFRADGHALQHSEHAVEPKQHAAEAAHIGAVRRAPITARDEFYRPRTEIC